MLGPTSRTLVKDAGMVPKVGVEPTRAVKPNGF